MLLGFAIFLSSFVVQSKGHRLLYTDSLLHAKFFDSTNNSISLGDICASDTDCSPILHSECRDKQCVCAGDYYRDIRRAECQPARHPGESCTTDVECRVPFTCENGKCECKPEFAKHGDKCYKKCQRSEIAIAEWDHKCVKLRDVGEECAYNEQCHTRFSECVRGRCSCRMGTTTSNGDCIARPHCPLGAAPLINGEVISCIMESNNSCPAEHHCQPYNYGKTEGFCCPMAAPRCPIGVPFQHSDCSNCPYDTHNCYTFNVGVKQHSLCCPNDCHRSAPIRHNGRCLPVVPFGGRCEVDSQCNSLLPGAVCIDNTCGCSATSAVRDGECRELSVLNGECSADTDCHRHSQLRCVEGKCKCAPEHMPEPGVDDPERCIPAATCPTASGLFRKINPFNECSEEKKCQENEICRKWWQEDSGSKSFHLCCPKPGVHDYTTVCGRFGMSLVLTNSIDALGRPLPCGLSPMDTHMTAECPDGSACVFNPFSEGEGICCRAHSPQ